MSVRRQPGRLRADDPLQRLRRLGRAGGGLCAARRRDRLGRRRAGSTCAAPTCALWSAPAPGAAIARGVRRAAGRRLLRVRDRHRRLYAVRDRAGRRGGAGRRAGRADARRAALSHRSVQPAPPIRDASLSALCRARRALRADRHRADARGGAGRDAASRRVGCPTGRGRRSAALLLIPIALISPQVLSAGHGALHVDLALGAPLALHRDDPARQVRRRRSSRSASAFAAGCSSPRCSSARWSAISSPALLGCGRRPSDASTRATPRWSAWRRWRSRWSAGR